MINDTKKIDIARLRRSLRMNQEAFRVICGGISQSYLSELENGKKEITEPIYRSIVENIGLDKVSDFISDNIANYNPKISLTTGVPYYNVDFIGGFDLVLNDQTIKPEYLIDFKMYNDATCWCNVTGHSMEPEISNGDIIALKELHEWRTFIPSGEVCAIVTTEHRTIKKVTPSNREGYLILTPNNKSPEYVPQEIPISIIKKVYKVLGCMKKI